MFGGPSKSEVRVPKSTFQVRKTEVCAPKIARAAQKIGVFDVFHLENGKNAAREARRKRTAALFSRRPKSVFLTDGFLTGQRNKFICETRARAADVAPPRRAGAAGGGNISAPICNRCAV